MTTRNENTSISLQVLCFWKNKREKMNSEKRFYLLESPQDNSRSQFILTGQPTDIINHKFQEKYTTRSMANNSASASRSRRFLLTFTSRLFQSTLTTLIITIIIKQKLFSVTNILMTNFTKPRLLIIWIRRCRKKIIFITIQNKNKNDV